MVKMIDPGKVRPLKPATVRRVIVFAALISLAMMLLIVGNVNAVTYKNIMQDYQKTYSHYAPEGVHSDTESYAWDSTLGTSAEEKLQNNLKRRHANCEDCHDPHSATRASSPLGSYFGAGTQANVSGVRPLYWGKNADGTLDFGHRKSSGATGLDYNSPPIVAAGEAPKYAFSGSVVKEYELCFKCHSSYAFDYDLFKATYTDPLDNNKPHDLAFNWTQRRYWQPGDNPNDDIVVETDTAREFNPMNTSYHPVLALGPIPGDKILQWSDGLVQFNETFMPGISADSLIKCSDCHTSDTSGVRGPHGSNQRYILKRPAPTTEPKITRTTNIGSIWYYAARGNFGLYKQSYTMSWYVRTNNVVCYECHSIEWYGPGKGHPSRGKHWSNCQWHRPVSLDEVGCASCKATPIHGSTDNSYLMVFSKKASDPSQKSWCYNCHNDDPGQTGNPGGYVGHYPSYPSCPRFYSVDKDGVRQEETRVHFQSSKIKEGEDYFVPLPTPDLPNLKGLGNVASYRYYNREDDYIFFKYGTPAIQNNQYKVHFDQPSSGDRPDGEPVGEVGYEDSISLWTVDHAKDTQVYVSVDGDVLATKSVRTARRVTDSLGNDLTDVINRRTANKDDRSGWFTGTIGYGNTIDEIYKNGNSFVMDFGDLSGEKTIKLIWGVNEEKGGKLPILVQIKDEKGKWVTRGSARHAEDRYGYLDIKSFFPKGTRDYQVKIIPTLNSIDFMAVSTNDSPVKVDKLGLKGALYTKSGSATPEDVTSRLATRDKDYVTFDYRDSVDLSYDIPAQDKTLSKRDFIFAPTGYYETGGSINPAAVLDPMTAEAAQDFGRLTPAGGYANHYNVELVDPGAWNETWIGRIAK